MPSESNPRLVDLRIQIGDEHFMCLSYVYIALPVQFSVEYDCIDSKYA